MRLLIAALPAFILLLGLPAAAADKDIEDDSYLVDDSTLLADSALEDVSLPEDEQHLKPHRRSHVRPIPPDVYRDLMMELRHARRKGRHRSRSAQRPSHWRARHYMRRHPYRASLAAAGVNIEPRRFLFPGRKAPRPSADVFPQSHELVGRALDSMQGELKMLRGQQNAAQQGSRDVTISAKKGYDGMYAGSAIRRKLTGAKAAVQVQNVLIDKLEQQERHLKVEHDHVWRNLHQILDPRISAKKNLVEKSQTDVAKLEKEVQRWSEVKDERKKAAIEMIQQRKRAAEDVRVTEEAIKKAMAEEAKAQEAYKVSQKRVGQQVQALKFADTKLKAAQATAGTEQELEYQQETALDRTQGVLKAEESRIETALSSSQVRLERRISHAKTVREEADRIFAQAKTSYAAWQEQQLKHSQEVTRLKADYEDKRRAFEANREDVIKVAADRAGARATSESDWNGMDWAWSGDGEWGEADLGV